MRPSAAVLVLRLPERCVYILEYMSETHHSLMRRRRKNDIRWKKAKHNSDFLPDLKIDHRDNAESVRWRNLYEFAKYTQHIMFPRLMNNRRITARL